MKMVNPLSQPGKFKFRVPNTLLKTMCIHKGNAFVLVFRYVPTIPMVLVNGSEGIGTGWSSYIPNYNPRDIVANVRRLLNGEQMEPMHPWYRGFKGTIGKTASKEAGDRDVQEHSALGNKVTNNLGSVPMSTANGSAMPVASGTHAEFKQGPCNGAVLEDGLFPNDRRTRRKDEEVKARSSATLYCC